jgi:hypothetical protein
LERPPQEDLRDGAAVLGREGAEGGLLERAMQERAVRLEDDPAPATVINNWALLTQWVDLGCSCEALDIG